MAWTSSPTVFILGIDPGPVIGITLLRLGLVTETPRLEFADYMQVTPRLLNGVLTEFEPLRPVLAIERFVVGSRAARSATAKAGAAARDTYAIVDDWRRRLVLPGWARSASEVKPWATDDRLTAAGIEVPSGMRHAKDAARHALFCAVKTYKLPDPLSRRAA